MLLDGAALGVQREDLKDGGEEVDEDDVEHEDAAAQEGRGVDGHVVEDAADDEALDRVGGQHGQRRARVRLEEDPAAPEVEGGLLEEGEGEGRLGALGGGLVGALGFHEPLVVFAVEGVALEVLVDLLREARPVGAGLPRGGELVGAAGRLAFHVRPDDALLVAGHGGEEVGRRLLLGADEAEVLKVGLCLVCLAEEDLPALVQDENFVKDLVDR